jgi:hypothetical protein
MSEINLSLVTSVEAMVGEDQAETDELKRMLANAEAYIRSFSWCPAIVERYLGVGIGGVIALFLFKLARPIDGNDNWLWVVEGDLPSAYLVTDQATNPAAALNVYCELMDDWSDAVLRNRPLADVFPVKIEPTPKHAEMLRSRTKFIRERIAPMLN